MEEHTLSYCIRSRRSVRAYLDQPVPRELLTEIVSAGTLAPSGSNLQGWMIYVYQGRAALEKIKRFTPGLGQAPPCLMLLCTDLEYIRGKKGGRLAEQVMSCMDIAMMAENMMLAAADRGLATCPIRSFQPALIARLLDLPETMLPQLMLSIGYPVSLPNMPLRRPLGEILRFDMEEPEVPAYER